MCNYVDAEGSQGTLDTVLHCKNKRNIPRYMLQTKTVYFMVWTQGLIPFCARLCI
jgi:hypothetical protein